MKEKKNSLLSNKVKDLEEIVQKRRTNKAKTIINSRKKRL